MRFLLGVLVGYTVRGKHKLLIKLLVTLLVVCVVLSAVVLPAMALLALRLDVQRERRSRPAQTKVPVLKGLTYEDAEKKLHAANLNIRLFGDTLRSGCSTGIDHRPNSCTWRGSSSRLLSWGYR